jgi:hypothetical protein
MACAQPNGGIEVQFQVQGVGAYEVEVVLDGAPLTCRVTIPLSQQPVDDGCASRGVLLTQSGSMLPTASQSIGGLSIQRGDLKSVVVRVKRDGVLLKQGAFTPNYVTTPGPNGPECEPKTCTVASHVL